MTAAERLMLERTRLQARKTMQIREKCNEIVTGGGYRSPSFDTVGGGSGEKCGLDGSERACEALLAELQRAEAELEALSEACMAILDAAGVRGKMLEFCAAYYMRGYNMAKAAEYAGVSMKMGYNYRIRIEKA